MLWDESISSGDNYEGCDGTVHNEGRENMADENNVIVKRTILFNYLTYLRHNYRLEYLLLLNADHMRRDIMLTVLFVCYR